MKHDELIEALRRLKVETGSLACLGCGREHNCSTQGCAILREAVKAVETLQAERLARRNAAELLMAEGLCTGDLDGTYACKKSAPTCNDCAVCLDRYLLAEGKRCLRMEEAGDG